MEQNRDLVENAKEIIRGSSSKVYKSTRSGFTHSAIVASQEIDKRILVISPTNRILDETAKSAADGAAIKVSANSACPKIQEEIGHDKFLAQMPLPLDNCEDCSNSAWCPITEILRKDSNVITITYQKIEALMRSKSKLSKKIREKLRSCNVVMLDEAHTIALPAVPIVPTFLDLQLQEGYPKLLKIVNIFQEEIENWREQIDDTKAKGDQGHVGKHLSKSVSIKTPLTFKNMIASWHELFDLAKKRKELGIKDSQILLLRDVISLLGGHLVSLIYRRDEGEADGRVHLAGNYWTVHRILSEFLTECVPQATHIYVSGTFIEPYPSYFSELSDKEIRSVIFPDLRNTNQKMIIYPDTYRLDSHSFHEKFKSIVERILDLYEQHKHQGIWIVAPNAKKAALIREKLDDKLGKGKIDVDYYRSDKSIGISRKQRICIAIGLAEVPSNTYDHLARGTSSEICWIDSQKLRMESVHAATWQAWSRVKDPDGMEESRVYCIGIRAIQISEVITWGVGRRLELEKINEKKLPDGNIARRPVFRVVVDTLLAPPAVSTEPRTSARRDRHSVSEYVERVEDYNPYIIFSEFVDILPINIYRENVNKFGIYNNYSDENERKLTACSLIGYFASRRDCYAIQDWPDKDGRCGYCKRSRKWSLKTVDLHLKMNHTIGWYQIDLDDLVRWICFDIDDHDKKKGETRVKDEIRKLIDVLNRYKIPFLLESSGSPNSYHVWVFLHPTRTRNAYMFSRQIEKEACIECEVFPKQKKLDKNNKYGNLVKVPLGMNRKTNVKSQFIDPVTFEPYPGLVPLPSLVRLREVPGERDQTRATRKVSKNTLHYHSSGDDLRYCIRQILKTKTQLNGSEGHDMRVAIGAEALKIRLSVNQAVSLFSYQTDFDENTSRRNVEYIYSHGYYRYSCETLQNKCNGLVSIYCTTCPQNREHETESADVTI